MKIKLISLITCLFLIFSITAKAGFEEGKSAFEKGNFATAKQELQPLADKGDAKAQNLIGQMYLEGKGEDVNYKKAMEWFLKAAEQGYPNSQTNIGEMYLKNQGVTVGYRIGYKKAMEWFLKAAEQGYPYAQANIGSMYLNGQGVAQDQTKAIEWYKKAAEQGSVIAQSTLGSLYYNKLADYKLAVEWYRKAAEQGDAEAQNVLGFCYDYGKGIEKDTVQAVEWYKKAAAQGNEAAKEHLAIAASKARAQQQKKTDEANGYKLISLTDFKLDAKSMKKGTKLLMQGYLEFEGEIISLADMPLQARVPNAIKVYLLAENSPREARRQLLDFQQKSCGYYSACESIVLGHVAKCTQTFAGTKIRDTYCLEVDEVRSRHW